MSMLRHSSRTRGVERLDVAVAPGLAGWDDVQAGAFAVDGEVHRPMPQIQAVGDAADADREALRRILGTMLASLIRGPGATRWICRLCDTGACRGAEGGCPVGNAARERYLS